MLLSLILNSLLVFSINSLLQQLQSSHIEAVDDIGVFFQSHPDRDFLFKSSPQFLRIGRVAVLEGLQGVGIVLFQVKAEVDLAHVANQGLMDLVTPADFVAFLITGFGLHQYCSPLFA
jgi:hypothetical protein